MLLMLELFWVASLLEVCLWLIPSMRWRRRLAPVVIMAAAGTSVAILITNPSIVSGLVLCMSLYRLFNLARLINVHTNEAYLRRITAGASRWIIGLQSALLLAWIIAPSIITIIIATSEVIGVAVLAGSTVRHLRTTRAPEMTVSTTADNDLPTLSVLIPARNETNDLKACLKTLIDSDYPKLEILVLDDCSQIRQTPEIIRSFAHDGVRFIQGKPAPDNWLAKNYAYQQLFEASNGEVTLFCGVDVRFARQSLRLLVQAYIQKRKTMMSLIPRNDIPVLGNWHQSVLLQPMRYAWELALPRRLFRRPPVLSTCWLAKREVIETAGGFGAVSRSIVPESYFARSSAVHDGYSFMQSSAAIGIRSAKSAYEQLQTAIRIRYPQVHRRVELVMLLTFTEVGLVALPIYALARARLGLYSTPFTVIATLILGLVIASYVSIVTLTYRRFLLRSLFALPVAVAADIIILNYSMLAYEFMSVTWKGRNVCIPVMRRDDVAKHQ